jgi:hypothetical protein
MGNSKLGDTLKVIYVKNCVSPILRYPSKYKINSFNRVHPIETLIISFNRLDKLILKRFKNKIYSIETNNI